MLHIRREVSRTGLAFNALNMERLSVDLKFDPIQRTDIKLLVRVVCHLPRSLKCLYIEYELFILKNTTGSGNLLTIPVFCFQSHCIRAVEVIQSKFYYAKPLIKAAFSNGFQARDVTDIALSHTSYAPPHARTTKEGMRSR